MKGKTHKILTIGGGSGQYGPAEDVPLPGFLKKEKHRRRAPFVDKIDHSGEIPADVHIAQKVNRRRI